MSVSLETKHLKISTELTSQRSTVKWLTTRQVRTLGRTVLCYLTTDGITVGHPKYLVGMKFLIKNSFRVQLEALCSQRCHHSGSGNRSGRTIGVLEELLREGDNLQNDDFGNIYRGTGRIGRICGKQHTVFSGNHYTQYGL